MQDKLFKWLFGMGIFLVFTGLIIAQQDIQRMPKLISGPADDQGFARKNIGAQQYQEYTVTTTTTAAAIPDAALVGFISHSTNVSVTTLSGMVTGRIYIWQLAASSASNVVFTKSANLRTSSTNATVTLTPTNAFTVIAVSSTVAKIQVPPNGAVLP